MQSDGIRKRRFITSIPNRESHARPPERQLFRPKVYYTPFAAYTLEATHFPAEADPLFTNPVAPPPKSNVASEVPTCSTSKASVLRACMSPAAPDEVGAKRILGHAARQSYHDVSVTVVTLLLRTRRLSD